MKHYLKLKNKIEQKKICFGAWVTLYCPAICEIFAKAGFDWITIDLEHSTLSIDQVGELIRVIDLAGSSPLIRLPSIDAIIIKRLMDAGAHGIILPNVQSRKDIQLAVSATRYFPKGIRGVGLARAQAYGSGFNIYRKWQKNGPIVIAQIESAAALPHLVEIFKSPGLSGFLIGPYDLSCSLGDAGNFRSTKFLQAKEKILLAARQAKCPAGIHVVEPNLKEFKEAIRLNYKIIACSADFRILDFFSRTTLRALTKN